jgi:hypothetical protein
MEGAGRAAQREATVARAVGLLNRADAEAARPLAASA